MGVIAVVAYFAGQHFAPVKTITKIEEKLIYREVESTRVVKNVKTVKKPDGSEETLDNSIIENIINKSLDSNVKAAQTVVSNPNKIFLQAFIDNNLAYEFAASYRFIGPVYIGAKIKPTPLSGSLGVGLSF